MAILKLDAMDRALLQKALHIQGIKGNNEGDAELLQLITSTRLAGTDAQLQIMQKGLINVGHLSRKFNRQDDARLAASLSHRIELFKKERRAITINGGNQS